MDKNFLKDEGNALSIQKHQLNQAQNKLAQIDNMLNNLQEEQSKNQETLDRLMELITQAEQIELAPDLIANKEEKEQMVIALQSTLKLS